MKYLIVGLGNIGEEYDGTRHNIGFRVLDAFATASNAGFEDKRYGFVSHVRVKNCELTLLKPSTYMNLSGNAVRYWMNKDYRSLPLGKLRLRAGGSDGGHNGLKNIASVLCSQNYARLKFGIGNDFPRGGQVDWVLGRFSDEELEQMSGSVDTACEVIKSFCLAGINITMNQYNKK